jgi:Bifunctional DNA primase/polymerase, N-terminal
MREADRLTMVLVDAALAYAARGWPVFPLHTPTPAGCSCGHLDCGSIGKHPRTKHGVKDATTDEAQIRAWWKRWPHANMALQALTAENLRLARTTACSKTYNDLGSRSHMPVVRE